MGQKLITSDRSETLKQMEKVIAECEALIDRCEIAKSEEWFKIAVGFARIQMVFEDAKEKKEKPYGCKHFNAYTKSSRCQYKHAYVSMLISAATVRRVLPEIPERFARAKQNGVPLIAYTEFNIRPLKKLRTDRARIAVVNAAMELAIAGKVKFTRAIAEGAEKAFNSSKHRREVAKEEAENTQPARNLKRLLSYTRKHQAALDAQPKQFWNAAEAEVPGLVKLLAQALAEFADSVRAKTPRKAGKR